MAAGVAMGVLFGKILAYLIFTLPNYVNGGKPLSRNELEMEYMTNCNYYFVAAHAGSHRNFAV